MRHAVGALDNAELDAAVAFTLGLPWHFGSHANGQRICEAGFPPNLRPFRPSGDWQHGGPLIEMHTIDLRWCGDAWTASCPSREGHVEGRGHSALVAAMRAFVRTLHPKMIDLRGLNDLPVQCAAPFAEKTATPVRPASPGSRSTP